MDYKISAINNFFEICRYRENNIKTFSPKISFSPNVVTQNSWGKRIGVSGLKETNEHYSQAFPDIKPYNVKITTSGDMAIADWNIKGTHQNTFLGIEGTNKGIDCKISSIFIFENKRIVYYQSDVNVIDIYQQIGFSLEKESYFNQSTIKYDSTLLIQTLQELINCCASLSVREVECISLFLHGYSAKNIALILGCSHRTVQNHLGNAMDKLGCNSKYQLFELIDSLELLHLLRDLSNLIIDLAKTKKK